MVSGSGASMDVLHLQGMTTPVMVSGAAVCGGLRTGAVSVDCSVLGACRTGALVLRSTASSVGL